MKFRLCFYICTKNIPNQSLNNSVRTLCEKEEISLQCITILWCDSCFYCLYSNVFVLLLILVSFLPYNLDFCGYIAF